MGCGYWLSVGACFCDVVAVLVCVGLDLFLV